MSNKKKDGSHFYEDKTITPIINPSGIITHYVAIGRDVSRQKEMEEKLDILSKTDPLTGTYNRGIFPVIENMLSINRKLALILFDIDHFKKNKRYLRAHNR